MHIVDRADALIGRFFALLMYRGIGFGILLAVFVIGVIAVTPFERILREDAYVYVQKALEIINGDYVPPRSNAVGWPVLLAAIFALFGVDDLFTGMFVARWVSIACVCAFVGMMYAICKRLIRGENRYQVAALVAVCAFMSSRHSDDMALSALTEPVFTFLIPKEAICRV